MLAVEVVRLSLDATKCVLKHIASIVLNFPKRKHILRNIAFVAATFGIALVKTAPVRFCACAVDSLAVIELELITATCLIKVIDMLTTSSLRAKLLARDGSDARACVQNQRLRLLVRSEVHRDIVVHKVSGVAIQWRRV